MGTRKVAWGMSADLEEGHRAVLREDFIFLSKLPPPGKSQAVGVREQLAVSRSPQGTRKMTQWLGTPAALLEDLGSIPRPTWHLTTDIIPVPWDPTSSSGLQGMQVVHKYESRQNPHIHKFKTNLKTFLNPSEGEQIGSWYS